MKGCFIRVPTGREPNLEQNASQRWTNFPLGVLGKGLSSIYSPLNVYPWVQGPTDSVIIKGRRKTQQSWLSQQSTQEIYILKELVHVKEKRRPDFSNTYNSVDISPGCSLGYPVVTRPWKETFKMASTAFSIPTDRPWGMGWHRMALSLARGGGLVSGEITVQIWIGAKEYSRIAGTPWSDRRNQKADSWWEC